ncbi:hypothetical protein [Kocuria sp. U4B]
MIALAFTTSIESVDIGDDATVGRQAEPKIDLVVLVVFDGSAMVAAYEDRLNREGIPLMRLDLTDPERPVLDETFLTAADPHARHAKFQGVILPSSSPAGLKPDELAALHRYESQFAVRQISASVWPDAALGMNAPEHSGAVDGMNATVVGAARRGDFGYLLGDVKLDDFDPAVNESYGHLATPKPSTGARLDPVLTTRMSRNGEEAVLIGIHDHGAREEMFNTFASNQYQHHFHVLAHGQLEWLTRGIHLGRYRNYFSVHVDDVLMANKLWSRDSGCNNTHGCTRAPSPRAVDTTRMTAADVHFLKKWQRKWDFPLHMVFNGSGSADRVSGVDGGREPLLDTFLADPSAFRWINHTYSHLNLGCIYPHLPHGEQKCVTDSSGAVQYVPGDTIRDEITENQRFAESHGMAIEPASLVTGEHSGLAAWPTPPHDNPYLAPALTDAGIAWIAADASRERDQRQIGSAFTVPRHPMNLFFDAATREQEVDEYNWVYSSRNDGGSGFCEEHPETSTCIEPLPASSGFEEHIVPTEARTGLMHVLGNDPRPHYVHQSNVTKDRIALPVLERMLSWYRDTYADNTPPVVPTMAEAGTVLRDQATWAREDGATAVYWRGTVIVSAAHSGAVVPVSMPDGTTVDGEYLPETYSGKDTANLVISDGSTTVLTVGDTGYGASTSTGEGIQKIRQSRGPAEHALDGTQLARGARARNPPIPDAGADDAVPTGRLR